MPSTEPPILFHYPQSIYSHRVLWYLWLRSIPYNECIQPPIMPRPILTSLSLPYRKIPLLAIGKDIYHDSRLIISKLEELYPNSALTPRTPVEVGVQRLFENWTIDGGIFGAAVKCMPYWNSNSLLQNKAFLDDRQTLMGGRRMSAESMEKGRAEGLAAMRVAFEMLEGTFLADGREWVLGGEGPTTADIDAVWPFEWVAWDKGMQGSLKDGGCGEEEFPRVYAWVRRFMEAVGRSKKDCEKPKRVNQEEVVQSIVGATSKPAETTFDPTNSQGLNKGDKVHVYPLDYGQSGKSTGILIGLSTNEIIIRNDKNLHLHFPRWNFTIKRISTTTTQPTIPPSITTTPKMTLIYHPLSPYTRKVYMLAHELSLHSQITLRKVLVAPIPIPGWSTNTPDVANYNPMAKIPCLLTHDVPDGLFDSRVICEYLVNLAGVKRMQDNQRYWQLRALHAAADGIMDAVVLITYEVRIRKGKGLYFEEWVEGQKGKISRVLDRFERAVGEGVLCVPVVKGPASADEVAVAVAVAATKALRYLGVDWAGGRPGLVGWMEVWEKRRSFEDTLPTKDWGGKMEGREYSKI
ncbi:hypothetical protein T440DRAFT_524010 [Plenodomus tracheiphilus IPT5]|uniref:GST N-terminal domain-containing protein n=1 Tax=Plenodomus tracheiphilus IPT5 TaxID=1408161 RepID=A0A6A7BQ81_9PLEO|nr:hypothetical protein T440DRAFT_524010 [Plenodomus tracheiphilus IPT5]